MNSASDITCTSGQLHDFSATQQVALGSRAVDRYGNAYRYAQAGVVPLVVGNVLASAAIEALHAACAVKDTAVGADRILVTAGAAAVAENQYAEGFAIVSVNPGGGQRLAIDGHAAALSGAEFVLRLCRDDLVRVALTAAGSKLDLRTNPYKAVIQAPITTLTSAPCGVAISPIPAGQFGWVQTWGDAAVLVAGTPAVGARIGAPGSAAGAAVVDSGVLAVIGNMRSVGVTGAWKHVFLTIAA